MSIFIDTCVFVGYINNKDEHHDVAVNLLEDIMRNRYRAPFTSDYIFDCTSIALIKGREIDYIASFDEDFNGIVNRVAE